MHEDEIAVSADVVRGLVADQFPGWKGLDVTRVGAQGTVNAIFRLGDSLTARFPLQPRADARAWLAAEADAAREVLGRTRFATPEPVAIGEPGRGYPMPWSVQSWIPGVVANGGDRSIAFAGDLAEFIAGVRALDPRGRTFPGSGRGGPDLSAHDEWMETCFAHMPDPAPLRRLWANMRELPRPDYPDTVNHGDLIPGNVLVAGDRLAGVLDVGGLKVADRALDLVAAWHLLDADPRRALRDRLGVGDLEWRRGRAWAFEQAMGAAWYYETSNPPMSEMGRRTLARIHADAA